jgi:hypothetical protein
MTYAITAYGGDVYTLGTDNSGNAIIWKNGSPYLSLGPILVTCMAIK